MLNRVIVTGGAGFIGSAVVRHLIRSTGSAVLVCDKLTYAGNKASIAPVAGDSRLIFAQVDIVDIPAMRDLFQGFRPDAVLHLAAESHVDRSIDAPGDFVRTNVMGTCVVLQVALDYWHGLTGVAAQSFRFLHVSTDEVFGSLGEIGFFSETSAYAPNSPYAASKAGADHLVRAWHRTYGFPAVLSNCSNNYGPYQFPEKLIPLTILSALEGRPLPVYGDGSNVRDWLFVDDHVRALLLIAEKGMLGETYVVGGRGEGKNVDVVRGICRLLNEMAPNPAVGGYEKLITFVKDRPGHDHRYAMDASKIAAEIGWSPQESFESGLRRTVEWYLTNRDWWQPLWSKVYGGQRLGSPSAACAAPGKD
jgi:dTDP-glucose 4,6-dehydratase